MSKNKPQKSLNTGKIQIIHGIHAVRAALLNTKRAHLELHITENNHEFAKNYKSKIKKILLNVILLENTLIFSKIKLKVNYLFR